MGIPAGWIGSCNGGPKALGKPIVNDKPPVEGNVSSGEPLGETRHARDGHRELPRDAVVGLPDVVTGA